MGEWARRMKGEGKDFKWTSEEVLGSLRSQKSAEYPRKIARSRSMRSSAIDQAREPLDEMKSTPKPGESIRLTDRP